MDIVRAVRDSATVLIDAHGEGLVLTDGRRSVHLRGPRIRSTDLDQFPGTKRLRLVRDGRHVAIVQVVMNPRA